jgi:hypothetical protein
VLGQYVRVRYPPGIALIALVLLCFLAVGCSSGTDDQGAQRRLQPAVSSRAFRYAPPESELRASTDNIKSCAYFGVGTHSTNARASSRHYFVVGSADAAFTAERSAFLADGWSIDPNLQPLAEPHATLVVFSRDIEARTVTADVRLGASIIDVTINAPGRGTCGS